MTNLTVLESLIGERITVVLRDRKETSYSGELLESSRSSIAIKLKEYGSEFIEIIPLGNVSIISHKLLRSRKTRSTSRSPQMPSS